MGDSGQNHTDFIELDLKFFPHAGKLY